MPSGCVTAGYRRHVGETAIFWFVRLRVVVNFLTDVSGQPIGPIFKGQESKKGFDNELILINFTNFAVYFLKNTKY